MNWVIYLFGSGIVFFLGIGFILAALAIFMYFLRPWQKTIESLFTVIGLLLIAASATPLPYWLYAVAGTVTIVWLIAERDAHGWFLTRRNLLRTAVIGVWTVALLLEVPCHLPVRLSTVGSQKLFIIGDSITAGLGGEQETWPKLLARSRPVEVVDLARMGATTASALQQAESLPKDGGLVLLEIGGNDLLGTTTAADFERDLDRLLDQVCVPDRVVLMFELPLPPFYNAYGRAQRRLASNHGVILIPKRLLASILTGPGATLDSIHLDQAGHEHMAEVVWSLIQPAFTSPIVPLPIPPPPAAEK